MSYFPNIPAANDDPSVSQGDIQTNFGTINSAFNLNHVALGTGTGQAGKHNFVEMPAQGSTPTTISGEGSLFTKTATGNQLFFVADNNATDLYQLTRAIHASYNNIFAANFNYNAGPPSLTGGWTFLPGGMLLQWGTVTCASGSTILFPVAFTSGAFSIQTTISQNTTNRHFVYVRSSGMTSFTTTQLDSGGSGETNTFTWMAIGV